MSSYALEPVLSSEEIGEALSRVTLGGAPALGAAVVLAVETPWRVVWANAAATLLFGETEADALTRRLFSAEPGGLGGALGRLPAEGAPRFERFRMAQGLRARTVTAVLSRPILSSGRRLVTVAVLDQAGSRTHEAWSTSALLAADPPLRNTGQVDPEGSDAAGIDNTAGASPPEARIAAGPPDGLTATDEARRGRLLAARFNRFLWQTDADHRVKLLSNGHSDLFGMTGDGLIGQSLPRILADKGCDPDGRFAAILDRKTTLSGVALTWPVQDSRLAVPALLGAVPVFGASGEFDGYRGFAAVDLTKVTAAPAAPKSLDLEPPSPAVERVAVPPKGGSASLDLTPQNPEALTPIAAPAHEAVQEAPAKADRSEALDVAPAVDVPAADATGSIHVGPADEPALPRPGSGGTSIDVPSPPADQDEIAGPHKGNEPEDTIVLDAKSSKVVAFRPYPFLVPNAPVPPADEATPERPESQSRLIDSGTLHLSPVERSALQEIARTLGAWVPDPAPAGSVDAVDPVLVAHELERLPPAVIQEELTLAEPVRDAAQFEAEAAEARQLADATSEALAVFDEDGRLQKVNAACEGLFGYARAAIVGRNFTALLAPESWPLALALVAGLKSPGDGAAVAISVTGRKASGATLPLSMTARPIGPGKVCAAWSDQTALAGLRQELARAQAEVNEARGARADFLAKISHEIRTPLNAILGFAEVILDERFGPIGGPRYREYVRDIHTSGAQVLTLIHDLFALSKMEAGRFEMTPALVDTNRIVSECVAQLQAQAHRERVIMRTSMLPHVPLALVDERALRQIMTNILSNAVRFNEPGGQVIVATAVNDAGAIAIRVRDTGVGMSDGEIATAMEPFRQIINAKPGSGGNGLGLPVTKALVEANQATMSIKSRKHEGTLVEIVLRADPAQPLRIPAA